jgi:hypothetical protein
VAVGSGGTVLQVEIVVHAWVAVTIGFDSMVSAFTKTGITCPVLNPKA